MDYAPNRFQNPTFGKQGRRSNRKRQRVFCLIKSSAQINMIGKLTSLDPLERNVELQISTDVLRSEISNPKGDVDPRRVTGYIIEQRNDVFHLIIKLDNPNSETIDFYRTQSKGDLALLLDLLDGTIGERPRKLKTN